MEDFLEAFLDFFLEAFLETFFLLRFAFLDFFLEDFLEAFLDDPQSSANHLVLGMDVDQRQQARGLANGNSVPHW